MHRGEIIEMRKGGELTKNKDEDRASPELSPIKRQKVKTIPFLDEAKTEISEFDTNIGNEKQNVGETATPLRRSKRNGKSAKRRIISRCTIKLPKSGICPLCLYKTRQSNWARHVKRHHPEYTTPIYNENNSEQGVGDVVEPIQCSSKSTEIDLPMIQLEHFLSQQIQHNSLFGVDNEDKKLEEEEEDVEQIRIVKEIEGNNGEEEYNEEAQKADELLFKELFPGRRIIIRRPINGVCQFCLKQISASNWSRHLRSLHLPDIFEMKKQELMLTSSKNDLLQIPQTSQNNLDTTQILNEMTLTATATASETKEIKIESFEQVEGEEKEREDSVDKTIASVIEGIKNDERKGTKRKLNVSERKQTKKSKSIIRLPKTNICPLCQRQVSPGNWSRHLKRHHPDYALPPEEDEQFNNEDNQDDYEEEDMETNSSYPSETPTEEQALLWSLCQEELDVQSTLANANKKVESIRKKIDSYQLVLSAEEIKIRELNLKAEQLAERRKELLLKRQEMVQNKNKRNL
uniref:C2H2-type domain-containing protein n=1 Tax=Meloidogyne hapla TaxID=6305 RepID=A0A1I8BTX5_MELHA